MYTFMPHIIQKTFSELEREASGSLAVQSPTNFATIFTPLHSLTPSQSEHNTPGVLTFKARPRVDIFNLNLSTAPPACSLSTHARV
jgi:hypothetical protein